MGSVGLGRIACPLHDLKYCGWVYGALLGVLLAGWLLAAPVPPHGPVWGSSGVLAGFCGGGR